MPKAAPLAAFLLLATAGAAQANAIWPALLLEARLITWYTIAAGLIVEFATLAWILRQPPVWAGAETLVMNAVSGAVGFAAIPFGGLIVSMPPMFLVHAITGGSSLGFWSDGALNVGLWVLTLAFATGVNTAVEGGILMLFKVDLSRRVWLWLAAANAVSVGIAMVGVIFDPPR